MTRMPLLCFALSISILNVVIGTSAIAQKTQVKTTLPFSTGGWSKPIEMSASQVQKLWKNYDTTYSVKPKASLGGEPIFEVTQEGEIEDISVDQIINTINKYREKLCKAVGNGEITIFLKAQGGVGLLIVSASGEAGVEAKIQCVEK